MEYISAASAAERAVSFGSFPGAEEHAADWVHVRIPQL